MLSRRRRQNTFSPIKISTLGFNRGSFCSSTCRRHNIFKREHIKNSDEFFIGVLISIGTFNITLEGVKFGVMISLRLILLIMLASLLTFTTSPIQLTDALEKLLSPLKKIGIPAHEFAMMMTIALRFIPTLIEELDKIMKAQKSRGADFETGGIVKRLKSFVPVLVPLFLSSFRRADELATAMEARCYRGGEGRTHFRQLKFQRIDLFAALTIAIISAIIFTL